MPLDRTKEKLNSLIKSGFVRNFTFLAGGKSVIVIIGFLTTPFIARFYGPEAYGLFSQYSSIVLPLYILSSGGLHIALIVSRRAETPSLVNLIFWLLVFFTLTSIPLLFFASQFYEDSYLLNKWFFICIGLFLMSLSRFLGNWNVTDKFFKGSSMIAIFETITLKSSSLLIGWYTGGIITGLIFAEYIGKICLILAELIFFVKKRIKWFAFRKPLKKSIIKLVEYKDYYTKQLPVALVIQLEASFIIILLSSQFTIEQVGSYSMIVSLFTIPIVLIANSAQPLITQRISEFSSLNDSLERKIGGLIYVLSIVTLVLILFAYLVGTKVVIVFLGDRWLEAAVLVPTISLLLLPNILHSISTGIIIGFKKNTEYFKIQAIQFLILAISVVSVIILDVSFKGAILIVVGSFSFSKLLTIFLVFRAISLKITWQIITIFVAYLFCFLMVSIMS